MRSSRTARKIVGSLSAAAVSVLLLGGAAAVATDGSAGHGLRKDTRPSAGHALSLTATSTSTKDGHGLPKTGHGLSTTGDGLSTTGHGLQASSSTLGHGL